MGFWDSSGYKETGKKVGVGGMKGLSEGAMGAITSDPTNSFGNAANAVTNSYHSVVDSDAEKIKAARKKEFEGK